MALIFNLNEKFRFSPTKKWIFFWHFLSLVDNGIITHWKIKENEKWKNISLFYQSIEEQNEDKITAAYRSCNGDQCIKSCTKNELHQQNKKATKSSWFLNCTYQPHAVVNRIGSPCVWSNNYAHIKLDAVNKMPIRYTEWDAVNVATCNMCAVCTTTFLCNETKQKLNYLWIKIAN